MSLWHEPTSRETSPCDADRFIDGMALRRPHLEAMRRLRWRLIFAGCIALVVAGCRTAPDGAPVGAPCDCFNQAEAGPVPDSAGACPLQVNLDAVRKVHPPKPNTRGSCTNAELALVGGPFADVLAGVSATCAGCLFSEAADTTNSQFFIWTDGTHTAAVVNAGACFGSPYSGGNADCGLGAEEQQSCLDAACPRDTIGNTTCPGLTNDECVAGALAGDCERYRDQKITNCGGLSALAGVQSMCFDSGGSPARGVMLLCGGAVSDAGSD